MTRPSILVVDDIRENVVAISALLASMNCRVVPAYSGNEALARLLEQPFVLMLLDAHMPGVDGFEVARYARDNPTTRDVPIIFLTALSGNHDNHMRGYGAGAVDFLTKPVDPAILRAKIRVFLELHQANQQLMAARERALKLEAAERLSQSRRVLLDELTRKNAELERANQELEQFAYLVAHDLREPLRMVTLYTGLLEARHGDALGEDGRRKTRFACEGAERLQRMLDDLALYVRIEREEHNDQPVDLGQLAADVARELGAKLSEAEAVFEYHDLPVVFGDAAQLSLLLRSLVDNSLKFRSDLPPRLALTAVTRNHAWVLSLSDNGIGVEPAFAPRAFQIFQRGHPHEAYPGRGVGLAVVQRIALRHGGSAWLEPILPHGTRVCVAIPIRQHE